LGSAGGFREKLPHGTSDFLDMRFRREVSGIQELNRSDWIVSPKGLGVRGKKNGSCLPRIASVGWRRQ
jgi:hypothetical protein